MEDPHQPIYDPCNVHKNTFVESKRESAACNGNHNAAEQLDPESKSLCHKITSGRSNVELLLFLAKISFVHANDEPHYSHSAKNDVRNQQFIAEQSSIGTCHTVIIKSVHRQVQAKNQVSYTSYQEQHNAKMISFHFYKSPQTSNSLNVAHIIRTINDNSFALGAAIAFYMMG